MVMDVTEQTLEVLHIVGLGFCARGNDIGVFSPINHFFPRQQCVSGSLQSLYAPCIIGKILGVLFTYLQGSRSLFVDYLV